jgi:DNA repair protein RecN (Recombination protein N)
MLATAQLEILDAHCGPDAALLRARVGDAYEQVRLLEQRVEELSALAGARDRELDLLRFELEEIEAVSPSEDEAAALVAERDRLRHLETLRGAAARAAETISPDAGSGVAEQLAACVPNLEAAAAIDAALEPLAQRLEALRYEVEDLGGELRRYALAVDTEGPGRLEDVEERLALLARLERKHGGTIADVLAHAEHCRARCEELANAEIALEAAEASQASAREERDALAASLSELRAGAAPRLAAAVSDRLAELAMPDAEFAVELRARDGGCGPRGTDAAEFLIAPNPGMPAGPLREIASGGELSRVMLALLSVVHGGASADARAESGAPAADDATLVFDEIDAGIGGQTARAVGEHLRALAEGRQIICITHLPQVASLATRHFTIAKSGAGSLALTTVAELEGDAIVGELVRMLGADADDRAARGHARELLKAA